MSGMRLFGPALMAVLAWGVVSFGAVYPWAYWPLYAAAAGVGLWAVLETKGWRDPRLRTLAGAIGAVVAAMVVQVIALPASLVAWLSPGVDHYFRQFRVGYHPATLQTLSIAPAATLANAAAVVALGLLLLGTARALRQVRPEWVASQLLGLGAAIALLGIMQKVLSPSHHVLVYGFWQPQQGGNPFGPFINRNHFAGWMAMVLPVVAAYAWALVQRSERPETGGWAIWMRWIGTVEGNRFLLVSSITLIMGMSLVLTGSRSGMVSLLIASGVLTWFIVRQRRRASRQVAAVVYLVLVLSAATTWAGVDVVASRFSRAPGEMAGRWAAWRDTVRIVHDFPIFGTGVGGYAQAMLVYQSGSRALMYAEAHNDYLQLVAEGGVVVMVPVALALTVFGVGVRHRLREGDPDIVTYWVRRGAVAGLVAAAAQSLVEFSLQMPGNAAMFVTLAALALHRARTVSHAHRF